MRRAAPFGVVAAGSADSTAGTSAASDSSASGVVDETDAKMSALATLQTKLDEYGMRSDVKRMSRVLDTHDAVLIQLAVKNAIWPKASVIMMKYTPLVRRQTTPVKSA